MTGFIAKIFGMDTKVAQPKAPDPVRMASTKTPEQLAEEEKKKRQKLLNRGGGNATDYTSGGGTLFS